MVRIGCEDKGKFCVAANRANLRFCFSSYSRNEAVLITEWGCSDYWMRLFWLLNEALLITEWGCSDYWMRLFWLLNEAVLITNWGCSDYWIRWLWLLNEAVVITQWGCSDYWMRLASKCRLFHNSDIFSSCIIHILYTGVLKLKENNSGAKSLTLVYTLFFSSSKCSLFHNSNVFGSCIIHILYTGCAKIKIIPAPKV